MTKFYLDPMNFFKWMHQNNADFTGAYVEGVLQDNFTVVTDRGVAAFYEHYVNPNMSDLMVVFGSFKSGEADKVNAEFIDFMNRK